MLFQRNMIFAFKYLGLGDLFSCVLVFRTVRMAVLVFGNKQNAILNPYFVYCICILILTIYIFFAYIFNFYG